MKKNDVESYLSIIAALSVIFTAMVSPSVSLILSIFIIVSYSAFKYRHMEKNSALAPFVLSALLACITILGFTSLRNSISHSNALGFTKYAGLVFAFAVVLYIFSGKKTQLKVNKKQKKQKHRSKK